MTAMSETGRTQTVTSKARRERMEGMDWRVLSDAMRSFCKNEFLAALECFDNPCCGRSLLDCKQFDLEVQVTVWRNDAGYATLAVRCFGRAK